MDNEEQESINYRFSGYNLPLIELDETGPAYAVLGTHPYYTNQPVYWHKPYWSGEFGNTCPKRYESETYTEENTETNQRLYPLLPL